MSVPASRLLLVEDEVRIAEFVIPDLRAAGFDVTHVKDGASGLAAILNGEHDLVILDVMLPVLDGFEVLSKVRETGNLIPVIFLSARNELPDRLAGSGAGGVSGGLARPVQGTDALPQRRARAQGRA